MTSGKQVLLSLIILSLSLLWFENTSTDICLQNLLFNSENHSWLLENPEWYVRFIFYDGIKIFLVILALSIFISLLVFRQTDLVRKHKHGLRIVLVSLIIVPSVTGALKATTNVACPRDLTEYGGSIPYIKVFESYPAGQQPKEKQRCFPAGHASGGFALMSLYFLFKDTRYRRLGLVTGIAAGCLTGGYKMLLGHHFLSHTITTMILAWLLINLIVILDAFITGKEQHSPGLGK